MFITKGVHLKGSESKIYTVICFVIKLWFFPLCLVLGSKPGIRDERRPDRLYNLLHKNAHEQGVQVHQVSPSIGPQNKRKISKKKR